MEPENGAVWQGRHKTEQILEVHCPKCGARPHKWCDRAGDKLTKRGRALMKAGAPPSHQERMWLRQGHAEHEFPALLAKQRPGRWNEPDQPEPRAGGHLRLAASSPAAPAVLAFPVRYSSERICAECALLVDAEVVVQSPKVIGYRCGAGHKWLARVS